MKNTASCNTAPSERLFGRRDLWKLMLPLVLELLLTLLVGMIDSVMVSSVSEAAVSGVSLVDTVMQLLIYIFAALGTGGAVAAGDVRFAMAVDWLFQAVVFGFRWLGGKSFY